MQVIKPSIEIIDMENYETIVKKIERIGRVCYKVRRKSRKIRQRSLSEGFSHDSMSLSLSMKM